MTDWLTANTPPELGPFLLLAATYFDVFRPVAIVVLGLFLLALAAGVRWVWRKVRAA